MSTANSGAFLSMLLLVVGANLSAMEPGPLKEVQANDLSVEDLKLIELKKSEFRILEHNLELELKETRSRLKKARFQAHFGFIYVDQSLFHFLKKYKKLPASVSETGFAIRGERFDLFHSLRMIEAELSAKAARLRKQMTT